MQDEPLNKHALTEMQDGIASDKMDIELKTGYDIDEVTYDE